MRIRLRSALCLLLCSGCTSGVQLAELPTELATAYCDTFDSCAGSFAAAAIPGDCQSSFTGIFRATLLANSDDLLARGTVGYDEAQAATCLGEIQDLGCGLLIQATPPSCRQVLTGTIAIGETCSVSPECVGDTYCDSPSCPTSMGTCATRKANGAACDEDDECVDGLVCEDDSCGPPAGRSGGPCGGGTGAQCPLGELCIGESEGEIPGTCTTIDSIQTAALGERCVLQETAEESPIFCQNGLHCAVTGVDGIMPSFECVEPTTSGGACFVAAPEMCPSGEYCNASPRMLMFEGTCTPLPTQGQPCAMVELGIRCAGNLVCAGEMGCVAPQDNGGACTVTAECFSGNCDEGRCSGPPLCSAS